MVQVRTSFRQEQVNRTKKSSYVNNEITSNISKIAFVKGDKNDQKEKINTHVFTTAVKTRSSRRRRPVRLGSWSDRAQYCTDHDFTSG